MARMDSFVRKFVNLWKSGCEASLNVESKAWNAYVNLRVGLGHDHPHLRKDEQDGGFRGGSPAKQRRKERREAERGERAKAEQVDAAGRNDTVKNEKASAEKADTKDEEMIAEEL